MEKGVHTCAPPISAPYAPHTPHPTPIPNFTTIGPAATEKQRRKICDTLRAARATCHSRYWHDSALIPYTVEGMGVSTKEDRLSIGLSVPEI